MLPAGIPLLVLGLATRLASALPREAQQILGHAPPVNPLVAPQTGRTGFVSLGDSYNAGIGTGTPGQEDACRRGLGAYPLLIAADLARSQGGNHTTSVQHLSCTGAVTADVLSGGQPSQVDDFNSSLPTDFGFLSLGGNDLGFFDVINACIFRFYSFYSGTCEAALDAARAQLEAGDFEARLQIILLEILDKARWEKRPWFFITVTGYARFFNDATDDCDDMSLGVWWNGPKLTKDIRLKMNALVAATNAKIRNTIDSVNAKFTSDKAVFVNFDDKFEGHRFCEPGVMEPDYDRLDTWFFLVGGPDYVSNATHPHWPGEEEQAISPASSLLDPYSCLETVERSRDWGELALCYMVLAKHRDPSLQLARRGVEAQNSMWYVPTYYGKTFHPRSVGHEAIRDKIYEFWKAHDY